MKKQNEKRNARIAKKLANKEKRAQLKAAKVQANALKSQARREERSLREQMTFEDKQAKQKAVNAGLTPQADKVIVQAKKVKTDKKANAKAEKALTTQ